MGSLRSKNWNIKYLLCSMCDIITKYAWVTSLKDKKGKHVLNTFIKIVNQFNHKPKTLSVDQGK